MLSSIGLTLIAYSIVGSLLAPIWLFKSSNFSNASLTNQIKYKEQQLKEYDKRIEYFGKDKPKIGLDFGDKSDKIIPSEKQIESMENATIKDAATDDDVDTDNDNPVASDDDETTV